MSVETVIDVLRNEIQNDLSDNQVNDKNRIKSRCVEICRVKYKCFLLICTLMTLLCINFFQILSTKINADDLKNLMLTFIQNTTRK